MGLPCLFIGSFAFKKILLISVSHELRHGVYREFPETVFPVVPYRMGRDEKAFRDLVIRFPTVA